MVCGKTEKRGHLNLNLKKEILEEFDSFKYLGSIIYKNGGAVLISRVNKGVEESGAVNRIWKVISINVIEMIYERIVVPTFVVWNRTWGLNVREKGG